MLGTKRVEGEEDEDMNQGGMGRKQREEGKDRRDREGGRLRGKERRGRMARPKKGNKWEERYTVGGEEKGQRNMKETGLEKDDQKN